MKNFLCLWLGTAMAALLMASCGNPSDGRKAADRRGAESAEAELHSDSLLEKTYGARDFSRVLTLADSLQEVQAITETIANYWRGKAYVNKGQYRVAAYYYQKVVDDLSKSNPHSNYYTRTVCNLTNLLIARGDYEQALRTALPAVEVMRNTEHASQGEMADLLTYIGFCQTKLGRYDEASTSFDKAFQCYGEAVKTDTIGLDWQNCVLNAFNTAVGYKDSGHYEESLQWSMKADSLLRQYAQQPIANPTYQDYYQGSIDLNKAVVLQKLHRDTEAEQAYQAFQQTNYAKYVRFDVNSVSYLVNAGRYKEAADGYMSLDKMLANEGFRLTLDNIQMFYGLKFRANMGAGRKDSALAVGVKIVNALDSAIVWQKNSDAAELATIYDTQRKETEIARQQTQIAEQDAKLSYQRWIGTAIAMILVVMYFIVYTLYRNKMHRKLKTAYDQLEETTAAKERIESELRIARDIQMSMVPHEFPRRQDLDLFASMTPAKEVGGDLYEYLLEDDKLYFCVGDVSGKGVPASLFMAQVVRLFRTLAAQHVMPADMATQMNTALGEDNEQGMFVTMFIGLINLTTGHLTFCNAGHNPPVLAGEDGADFLTMETNAPIGLWTDLQYVGEEITTIKHELLFVYTDGLNEAENPEQRQFGDDRLLDGLRDRKHETARQVIEAMGTAVEKYRSGAEPNDDLTMMCLRVC